MVPARPAARTRDDPDRDASAPRVLLTGFDPFGGDVLNPSWLAARQLAGRRIAPHRVVAAQLPTVFGQSLATLRALLARHRPTLVICVGQAGGRALLSLERVAINVDDAPVPDNAGARPLDSPIVPGGPAAYFTGLPIKAMLLALNQAGVPAEVSRTAGTFVCNYVFYGLMHEISTRPDLAGVRGGFIHLPWLSDQGAPSMVLCEMVRGLRIAVRSALTADSEIDLGAGAIH